MKFFSINRRQAVAFTTLLVVLAVGMGYFFFYLPANESHIQKQNFRVLQNVDKNIHEKIDNSVALINNLLTAYYSKDVNREELQKYIDNYPDDNFKLALHDQRQIRDSLNPFRQRADSNYTIKVDDDNQQFSLFFIRKDSTVATGHKVISMRFRFDQFIKMLLPENVFDEYVVFGNKRVVYETFPSGLAKFEKDSILNLKNGIGGSGVKNVTIGGVSYKLFLQPVYFDANNQWVIGGLMSNSRYQQERSQLPFNIVLFLLTVALGITISFPWIKLFNMGGPDRVTLLDGVWTIVVSILLMSLVFLAFFKYNVPVRPVCIPDSKEVLANRIENSFNREVSYTYNRLYAIDSLMTVQKGKGDLVNLRKATVASGMLNSNSVMDRDFPFGKLDTLMKGVRPVQVFWLNKNGFETYNWTVEDRNAPHGDYQKRGYYREISDSTGFHLNGHADSMFYLDQVTSWTTGTFTSVMSLLSGMTTDSAKTIAAMSFAVRSLDSVILPAGYLFAVTDQSGKVLYHSDKTHNLNENLFTEFSEGNRLRSNIEARTNDEFLTKYLGRQYIVRVQQLGAYPMYIVIMADKNFKDTRDIEVYSFTFGMFVCFFLFFTLQLLVIFLVAAKRSFFKKQFFDTSWVGPRISFHVQYLVAALFHLFMIALLCCFFMRTSFMEYVFILLFAVTFSTLFLTLLYAKRYREENKHNNYKYKLMTVLSLAAFILLINIGAIISRNGLPGNCFLLFEGLSLIGFFIFYWIEDGWQKRLSAKGPLGIAKQSAGYTQSFAAMLLTRLILSSGVPVAFFYTFGYNYEQNLSVRYKHYDFAQQLMQKFTYPEHAAFSNDSLNLQKFTGIYSDSCWIDTCTLCTLSDQQIRTLSKDYQQEDLAAIAMLRLFRFYKSELAVGEDAFNQPASDDRSILFNNLLTICNGNDNTVSYIKTRTPGQYIKLRSLDLTYQIPLWYGKGFLFWMLLGLTMVVFYYIIYRVIRKLFALNLPDTSAWSSIDERMLEDNTLNNLLFIIGAPGAGKLKKVLEVIKLGKMRWKDSTVIKWVEGKPEESNMFIADMLLIPDIEEGDGTSQEWKEWKEHVAKIMDNKNKLIIINHFEYNINSAQTNNIKLNLLESLMYQYKAKVIVVSTVHPVSFLDSVNSQTSDESTGKPGHDLQRWHVLLGHYRILIMPLRVYKTTAQKEGYELMERETQYTHFLQEMQAIAIQTADSFPGGQDGTSGYDVDSLAFKLQVTSHYFYMYIWQSLTKEEKFLLYDLAEDGLVNSFDDYNLSLLVSKGIIVHVDGSLRLFNKGFRNFILTAIGNSEAMKIKTQIRDNGSWASLRTPLMLVTVAILAFLLVSQQEVYATLITYVTVIGAGVPAVLKIFSFFDKNSKANS
ncbi:PDC sensor domain-containing protein [Taibaiella soli]|uniref:Cache domain-containing protein n=1 Tax=Taibaiella soli TaxID=1649169 RepID=A0A2W2AP38_9BACT|nr:cache domain-containing protein [Taibaiella soli]PZF74140.1 hypothetical protein DN068_03760 [Taibaiella soli]